MEFYKGLIKMVFIQLLVSIPNGMEFYEMSERYKRLLNSVSIPNGMEFYQNSEFMQRIDMSSFNSQRDGILQIAWQSKACIDARFNSQRDGILRRYSGKIAGHDTVSIPNGMEFYGLRTITSLP